jgi:uncharacterized iron-regulated membrane protein
MANANDTAPSGLYHFIWRWHFYAGLFVAPFVVILALTGALYLFNDEIEGVLYRDIARVASSRAPVAASLQEAAVRAAYPGAEITRYEAPIAPDRASEWTVRTADGRSLVAFVDPGSGLITGDLDNSTRLGTVLTGLHGELLAGRPGDMLVEFAGCWAFVLLVTGLFLWWPRKQRRVGVAVPKLNAKGRAFWRELHAVPAMWNAPIIAFLILTGLPWSSFWGENLARIGTIEAVAPALAPTPNFVAAPNAPQHAEHNHAHDQGARLEDNPDAADLPWSVRQATLPLGGEDSATGIDDLIDEARARGMDGAGLRVIYPSRPGGVFTLSYVPDQAQGQRTVHIDPASGAVLQDIGWAQYSPLGKAVEFGVETHVGRQFGPINQWLLLASCMLLIFTVGFGVIMWWARRPRGKLGVPPAPTEFRWPWTLSVVVVGLGVVFPLVGLSMIAIFAIEGIRRRRPL